MCWATVVGFPFALRFTRLRTMIDYFDPTRFLSRGRGRNVGQLVLFDIHIEHVPPGPPTGSWRPGYTLATYRRLHLPFFEQKVEALLGSYNFSVFGSHEDITTLEKKQGKSRLKKTTNNFKLVM